MSNVRKVDVEEYVSCDTSWIEEFITDIIISVFYWIQNVNFFSSFDLNGMSFDLHLVFLGDFVIFKRYIRIFFYRCFWNVLCHLFVFPVRLCLIWKHIK